MTKSTMITNPSCQSSDAKESEAKFHAPNFEDDLQEIGGSGNGPIGGNPGSQNVPPPPTTLTDLSGYSGNYSQHGGHNHYNGHYNHYNNSWHQSEYNYYTQQGYYGTGHYPGQSGQPMYHQEQWSSAHQGMVLPPGPSPTGSNNSPSPHGFSDTNDDHLPHRTDLKRPSPDSFGPHSTLGPQSLHHQPPVTKKPKVSKRRKKRDPNEPQKPVSAYALFFRDTQANIKSRHPNANFGEVSKIVAATWDSLDPENKAAYKRRTEVAKKEYLRALAAYRANLVSKGSGHELYGGFPGYGPMLVNGSAMEQAMPATGLVGHGGLVPGNISPGSIGPGSLSPGGMMGQGIPPHYNGSYHPGYIQQIQQHNHVQHGNHLQQQQHSPGPDNHSPRLEPKLEPIPELDGYHENYENGQFRPGPNQYPPHSQGGPVYPSQKPSGQAYPPTSNQEHQYSSNQASGKCGRPGCRHYTPGHSEFCSSECVVGECKEVFDNWSSCMVKPGPGGGSNPDVMVK